MSLDWNTKECPDNGVTSGWIPRLNDNNETQIHPDTNSLVWGAFCGFHVAKITPKNIDEVVWRIEFLKNIERSWMSDGSFPTPDAVSAHLGLTTNCDTKTRKQWLAFITRSLSDDADRSVDRIYTTLQRVEEAANNVHDGVVEAVAS